MLNNSAKIPQHILAPELRNDVPANDVHPTPDARDGLSENASTGPEGRSDQSQTDILLKIAGRAKLFHTPDGKAYADLEIDHHRQTWPVGSQPFCDWLTEDFLTKTGRAPNSESLKSTISTTAARARLNAPERDVFVRVGRVGEKLYLDLCDKTWRAIEISRSGWRLIDRPPLRFLRSQGMQALPVPETGGSIESLRPFLNIKTDADFVLVVAWILAAFRDRGPYPLLIVSGEQGSAKSTFSKVLSDLIDPNVAPLRTLPSSERDLFIMTRHRHLLSFDNLSGLPAWLSDAFCRVATGAAFSTRRLYSNDEEEIFTASRPTILNGIEDIVTRSDLADRAIFLTLDPIADAGRKTEEEFWAAFESEKPQLLGALLDGLVVGLQQLPNTKLPSYPRMADFAKWGAACETAYWPAGTFSSAYKGNRDGAVEDVIDANPVATAVREFMQNRTQWKGTSTDLLKELGRLAVVGVTRSKDWPSDPGQLSQRLRRATTFLRKLGIECEFTREGRGRARMICITSVPTEVTDGVDLVSAASAASAEPLNPKPVYVKDPIEGRTDNNGADTAKNSPTSTVRENPLKHEVFKKADGADGADARNSPSTDVAKPGPGRWSKRI
jgi:hypothetical protein